MEFLSRQGIEYTDKNVRDDAEALRELLALGARGTPAFKIGDEVQVGFDPNRLLAAIRGS